jgi:hypothetical protein
MAGTSADGIRVVLGAGALQAVLASARDHRGAPGVAAAACGALAALLAEGQTTRALAAEAGAIEVCATMLNEHRGVSRVVETACAALAALVSRSPQRMERAGESGAITAVVVAMFAQGGNASVQRATMAALCTAVTGAAGRGNAGLASTAGIVEATSTAMVLHPDDPRVAEAACRLLAQLLPNSATAVRSAMETDVADLAYAAQQRHPEEAGLATAVEAVRAALAPSDASAKRLAKQKAEGVNAEEEIPAALLRMWDWLDNFS